MKTPSFFTLNVILAVVVVLGLVSFTAMPSALQIVWTLATILLAGVVVYQGFRRFFSSSQGADKADK